ncbi:twin transmembrane helix small protein [Rhodospirillales bacterium]|nr:twin transmembrane helix small protein [Rhodospirillales bacterium]
MHDLIQWLPVIILFFIIATFAALFIGITGMVTEKKANPMFRNKMMRLRIILQAIVVILFLIMIFYSNFQFSS